MADRDLWTMGAQPGRGEARTMKMFGEARSLITADLAVNRTVGLTVVPAGFVLTAISVTVTDLDTGGSPALVFHIGDVGDPDRLVASATTGQAGGTTTTLASTGLLYEFPADTVIQWTTATAAATAAAGTVTVLLTGYMK